MSQTVQRAISLIRRSAEQPISLTEAAEWLDVHKSTALRLLQTLESARFVRRTHAGHYVVGHGLIELAELALGSIDLRQLAASHLRDLQQQTGHTVHLAQLTGDEITYIDKVNSPAFDAVTLPSRIGRSASLYASAVGKVILAHLPRHERDYLLSEVTFERYTDTTLLGRDALEDELATVHEQGWAVDDGEHDTYVMCVAAPIRDARGRIVAAASITAIEVVASLDDLKDMLPTLLHTAGLISDDLGYAPSNAEG